MRHLAADLRYALRLLAKHPGFTAVAVLTLALGVGANTAIFSVVDGVLLSPLPFPEPDRLVFLTRDGDVSLPDGVDWRAGSRSLQSIALMLRQWAFDLTGEGDPERVMGVVAEADYFDVLGVRPLLGRLYTRQEDRLGGPRVALISYGFWQRRFAGDPAVIGRKIVLSDHPTEIVGVLPPEADFLHDGVELWVPPAVETPWAVAERGTNNFDAIARLAPGATLAAARAEMLAISQRLAEQYPKTNRGKIIEPLSMLDFMVRGVRRALLVLLGAVGLVLLVASVNLASLLLARATGRREELAVRLALGAGRRRLLAQLLTEGLVLAAAGGIAGTLVALWGKDLLLSLAPASLPRAGAVAIDGRVLAFAFAVSVLSGLLFSLLPALSLLRQERGLTASSGRGTTAGAPRQRLLGVLVASEVGLAFVLLIASGLLAKSLLRLARVDLGFDPHRVLSADVVLPESRYSRQEAQTRAFQAILERVSALPGVEAAATVIGAPLELHSGIGDSLLFLDGPKLEQGKEPGARARPVGGDYFRTLGQPILAGRAFTPADDAGAAPVAIVNQTFARRFFPGESPLGKRVSWRDWTDEPRWMTVVGVTADLKSTTLDAGDAPAIYLPYVQRPVAWQRWGTLLVRTRGEPEGIVRPLRDAIAAVDPALPLSGVGTLEQRFSASIAQQRFNTSLLAGFALVALALAVEGIYGLLAYTVGQRRRELGLRMALGAGRGDLVRLVLYRGMALALAGLLLGAAGAAAASRVLAGLLFEVEPFDAATYLGVALLLAATALFACWLPARRAARLDPMTALRYE